MPLQRVSSEHRRDDLGALALLFFVIALIVLIHGLSGDMPAQGDPASEPVAGWAP